MAREDIAIAIIWAAIISVATWGAVQVYQSLADYAPAIIAGIVTMLGWFMTHALTAARELHLEEKRQKTKNYADLINRIGNWVRNRRDEADSFDTAHLHTWVVGSQDVVRCTQRFAEKPSQRSLRAVLDAMRNDIGLTKLPTELIPAVYMERDPRPDESLPMSAA